MKRTNGLRPALLLMIVILLATTSGVAAEVVCSGYENQAILASTPTAHFTDHGDGTVTHIPTGLTWMRCILGQSWDGTSCGGMESYLTWSEALAAIEQLNVTGYAGHNDWRLPNINELASIIEDRCANPSLNTVLFPDYPSFSANWVFSSSPRAGAGGEVWGVLFTAGYVDWVFKSSSSLVRPVRGGD